MARTDTLANYITDISNAVREKTGKTDLIKASELDTEIASIEGGVDINDYFDKEITTTPVSGTSGIDSIIKKIPSDLKISTTNWSYMFNGCMGLSEIPFFDTSEVTDMRYAFNRCSKITTIPQFNTSKVTSMYYMFQYCANLKTLPLLDTSEVTNMSSMFVLCTSLETIPQFNTSKVTTMSYMFQDCTSLTSVPQLDASMILDVSRIFEDCSNLTNLGGFINLGQAYLTTRAENYNAYKLELNFCNKLTHESLMNVINNLYDIKTKGCKNQSLVLGSTNKAKLTEEEIAIATNKGWNVS